MIFFKIDFANKSDLTETNGGNFWNQVCKIVPVEKCQTITFFFVTQCYAVFCRGLSTKLFVSIFRNPNPRERKLQSYFCPALFVSAHCVMSELFSGLSLHNAA